MIEHYTPDAQTILLGLVRQTLEAITNGQPAPDVDVATLSPGLAEERACFVTLRRQYDGSLRGCTGTLVARRSLAEEVVHCTEQTALRDPRFTPVTAAEVPSLHLEISVLTPPQPLVFDGPDDLLRKLRPGVDGVTLKLDKQRATFLPQVWASYPDPRTFLSLLSEKMRCGPDGWRDPRLEVELYQAIVIEESE